MVGYALLCGCVLRWEDVLLQAAKVAFEQQDGAVLVTDPSGNGLRCTVGRVPAEQVPPMAVLRK